MRKGDFWNIIEESKRFENDWNGKMASISQKLQLLDKAEICAYEHIFNLYIEAADFLPLWLAYTIMNQQEQKEEEFVLFCAKLIYEGKDRFLGAVKNPDTLSELPEEWLDLEQTVLGLGFELIVNENGEFDQSLGQFHLAEDVVSEITQEIEYWSGLGEFQDQMEVFEEIAGAFPNLCSKYRYNPKSDDIMNLLKMSPEDIVENLDQFQSSFEDTFLDDFRASVDVNCKSTKYDMQMAYEEGLSAVLYQDKWGYIDYDGNEVIKPAYEKATSFSNGLATVMKKGKWGYINLQGEVLSEFKYDEAGLFINSEFAMVVVAGKKGFINIFGKEIIPPIYEIVRVEKGRRGRDKLQGYINGRWDDLDITLG